MTFREPAGWSEMSIEDRKAEVFRQAAPVLRALIEEDQARQAAAGGGDGATH